MPHNGTKCDNSVLQVYVRKPAVYRTLERGAPSFLGSCLVYFLLFHFIVNWRQRAVVRVLESGLVKHLDVIKHVLPCRVTCEV